MLLDLDSTLFETYGSQEGQGFNFHSRAHIAIIRFFVMTNLQEIFSRQNSAKELFTAVIMLSV